MADMTALELAEAIGRAVHCAIDDGHETRADAVLRVLRQSGYWFSRLTEDARKGPDVQLPLEG